MTSLKSKRVDTAKASVQGKWPSDLALEGSVEAFQPVEREPPVKRHVEQIFAYFVTWGISRGQLTHGISSKVKRRIRSD